MRTVDANKHYNFETSGVAWHLESDGAAWIYVAITSPSYPLRHAAGLLRDLVIVPEMIGSVVGVY